ncbi:MAG: glycosyltransferase [Paracoccaceae bacterium]|nr:MAG: glycosyltransferase [Paracoccaceae bacterium]
MKILFVHQNFPGQFPHLAPALKARGHEVRALTDMRNTRPSPVPVMKYRHDAAPPDPAACRLGRNFTQMSDRGVTVARAALSLREKGYVPDVVFGHSGWGETLFLKEIWPAARHLVYAEYYYRGIGQDVGFDPEFDGTHASNIDPLMIAQARAAHLGQALLHADAAVSPTFWQADSHPPALRSRISVIFDGIDTATVAPNPEAAVTLPGGLVIRAGDEVLTFVNRNLEPYRGYHVFMRALPAVMAARPGAQVVIVGGDEVSYGRPAPSGTTWKSLFLKEVEGRIDLSRVHFLGRVPYPTFVALMQLTRVHAYLTYPFVLSWSMLEAMSAGALVVGSSTPPVREVIADGVNGRLVDFFDVAGWSAALTEALAEPARFDPLRQAARATVLERYDLRGICLPQMIAFAEGTAR